MNRLLSWLGLFTCLVHPAAHTAEPELLNLLEMDLAQLMEVEIVSAAKKPQSLAQTTSAVFVITQEDIRRSGARNLPDVLRMVPGMNVSSFNSHTWSVTARGFSNVYANKLLVLLDGRTVYAWEFTGTRWHMQDIVLDDIERIEVIRGPGGTLWGANAVNGVINIITRSAHDTPGGLLSAGGGDLEQHFAEMRYGGGDQALAWRVYGKSMARDGFDDTLSSDAWQSQKAGFRLDGERGGEHQWTVTGDVLDGKQDNLYWDDHQPLTADFRAWHLLGRWQRAQDNGRHWQVQGYVDHYEFGMPAEGESTVADLEWQQRIPLGMRHDLMWGGNLRWRNNTTASAHHIFVAQAERNSDLYSLFVQDDINLVTDRWRLTVGTKIEHQDETGIEFAPNLRLLWTPNSQRSLWAAVSRAVRTPTRLEREVGIELDVDAEAPVLYLSSNPDLTTEILLAYELGWREQFSPVLSWDLSLFRHNYREVVDRVESLIIRPDGRPQVNLTSQNQIDGYTYGAELALDWRFSAQDALRLAYSYLDVSEMISESEPRHQISLRGGHAFNKQLRLDMWLRHVSQFCGFNFAVLNHGECLDAYTTLDARLAWQVTKNLELSIVGQNLLEDNHLEFESDSVDWLVGRVPRSMYAQVRWVW